MEAVGLFVRVKWVCFLLVLWTVCGVSVSLAQKQLQRFENCQLIETPWADGDSFQVKNAEGKKFTIRLYGVDCLESHVNDNTDARRLYDQRRYFGISNYGGSFATSIAAAKGMGNTAKKFVVQELAQPFAVITSFSDARGDGKYKRYYGFITTQNGDDLAELLVRKGYARAFGVNRKTIDGRSHIEQRESLKDLEFRAAIRGAGVWKLTDWEALPDQRRAQRAEAAELELAKGIAPPLDPDQKIDLNSAPRDVIMQLPGIGEAIANRIIEGRPYKSIESIIEVDGIGAGKLAKIRSFLKME